MPSGKLCLYGFRRTTNLIVVIAPILRQLLIIELNGKLLILVIEINVAYDSQVSHNYGSLQYKFETAIFTLLY